MASDLIYREDAKVFVRHACYKKINPIDYLDEVPAADVVPVEWVPVKERLPEPCFPVWAACKAADGRENLVIETSYIPNPQSKSQWGPVPILETGRATVYAWAERHPPEAPKEG